MENDSETNFEFLREFSNERLKKEYRFYRILWFYSSDEFLFCFSLGSGMSTLLFFPFVMKTWFYLLLFHYFVYWKLLKPYYKTKLNSEKDLEEIKGICDAIKTEIQRR